MNSSVTITSPRPNNELVHVLRQTVDEKGDPVGDGEAVAVLDDGESVTLQVDPHTILMVLAQPRNAAFVRPEKVAEEKPVDDLPAVIGSDFQT